MNNIKNIKGAAGTLSVPKPTIPNLMMSYKSLDRRSRIVPSPNTCIERYNTFFFLASTCIQNNST